LAKEFILVRQTRMREVNLELFDFDYDLTWMGFFLDANDRILGRYGGRDETGPDSQVSLNGLRYAMERALARHKSRTEAPTPRRTEKVRTVMDFAAAAQLSARACVHCHQVYDLRRHTLQTQGKWRLDELWVYPQPENVGLSLAVDQGDRITRVRPDSPADHLGLKKEARLLSMGEVSISSIADLQYALHRAPTRGKIRLVWEHQGKTREGEILLGEGWRKTDISWRWSLRGLDPPPWVHGDDLSNRARKALGIPPGRLALEQGPFVSEPARQAGIRQGDILLGVDGKMLELTARQFGVYIRLNYKVGDRVVYHLLRAGKRMDVTITLRGRGVTSPSAPDR
jgi:S1-C subfamily serine protease